MVHNSQFKLELLGDVSKREVNNSEWFLQFLKLCENLVPLPIAYCLLLIR